MGTTWLLNKTGGETSEEPQFLTRDFLKKMGNYSPYLLCLTQVMWIPSAASLT